MTQRGNNRRDVFFDRGDGLAYLRLLRESVGLRSIEVVAYCLMPNHVHLVVVPATSDGLQGALKVLHGRHAQRINRTRRRNGHLWQNRYFSSPLDAGHFLNAVRYVELNPVRAGLAERAEDYEWSSAAAHCGLRGDPLVEHRPCSTLFQGIRDWSAWLAAGPPRECVDMLRRHVNQNLPCGSASFIESLEATAGRSLRYKPRGRPAKPKMDNDDDASFLKRCASPLEKGTVTPEKR